MTQQLTNGNKVMGKKLTIRKKRLKVISKGEVHINGRHAISKGRDYRKLTMADMVVYIYLRRANIIPTRKGNKL